MQDFLNSTPDDEIDLRELFMALWAYKLFIVATCALGIMFGGYKFLTTSKQFSSTAIFRLEQESTNGILGAGDIGKATLSALTGGTSKQLLLNDMFTGRIFIQNLDDKLNFQKDTFFNTYNPNEIDPIWKSYIDNAIGWQKPSIDTQEAVWQSIVESYAKNIKLDQTEDGAFRITVTHTNAKRSANIANEIMNEIITKEKDKKNTDRDQQLSFLSKTLAKAQGDLEVSQSNLKEFALKNSALPIEIFAQESMKLDVLREKLSRTSKLHEAVGALSLVMQSNKTDQSDYLELRQKFPIVDQVEFRRILGQNEIISSWSWPETNSVDAVFDTLSERKNRLKFQINASKVNAERSGMALETYAKLEREAEVSKAAYTVLIEQVKAQSLISNYLSDKTEIYEYASAPINPSAPNRSKIVALWGSIGLFFGTVLALILANWRDTYYSKKSLLIGARAHLTVRAKSLKPLRNKSLDDINTILMKKPRTVLRDMAVEIHKSDVAQVVVTSSHSKLTSNDAARALASYMHTDTLKIAVINFSSRGKKLNINDEKLSIGSFVVTESLGHVSILEINSSSAAMELLSQKDFRKNTHSLKSTFDLVFLCADNNDAPSLLNALEGQKMFHITLAKTKKTKATNLEHMRSLLPIQGLIYD